MGALRAAVVGHRDRVRGSGAEEPRHKKSDEFPWPSGAGTVSWAGNGMHAGSWEGAHFCRSGGKRLPRLLIARAEARASRHVRYEASVGRCLPAAPRGALRYAVWHGGSQRAERWGDQGEHRRNA